MLPDHDSAAVAIVITVPASVPAVVTMIAELGARAFPVIMAALDHDRAKTELKVLVPQDAKEASGHGVRAKRSKSGAISFELLIEEASDAALQP